LRNIFICALATLNAGILWTGQAASGQGKLEIRVVDKQTGQPTAVRMHLKDRRGRPVRPPAKTVHWRDHFVFDGKIQLELPNGDYSFELERGPEYKVRHGSFTIGRGAKDSHAFEMERFVDMKQEGWWSGELHVHRPRIAGRQPESLDVIPLLMRAEDLHVAPIITWWNDDNFWKDRPLPESRLVRFDENRFYHLMAGEDEREGGALLYFNLDQPLEISGANREYPSPVVFLEQAHQQPGVHIDIEKPFWWDVPIWIATGKVDSIGLANNHMQRSGMLATEAWGKPRDKRLYPNPHGNGQWTQHIYYELLNCGLRIPPSAGSASGVLPNPVGYNRVYVHCGETLDYDHWWEGLRAGRVVVTNGPLLRPQVNNQLPGHVFTADKGETVRLETTLQLSLRDQVDALEIIKNGRVVHSVKLRDYAQSGQLPAVTFQNSGWMLVRAIAKNDTTFRFASSGPYYVEIGDRPRISKKSAKFFLGWVYERANRVKLDNPDQRAQVIKHHRAARTFWQDLVDRATVE